MIPYGRQSIDEDDIKAVVDVLRSDWLTTGPAVEAFEKAVASRVGASGAVAVSNGTAALHVAYYAAGIGPGDEVIVPAMTFAATANAALYLGARPVFADVGANDLLIDVEATESLITPRTRAIVAVDYAGQPCDYAALAALCRRRGLKLIADAAHSLGGAYKGTPVGALADITTFSFHPVKHITTAEGGMVVAMDPVAMTRAKVFRSHGITTDHRQRERQQKWFYEMQELGFNYRLSDIQCALGLSQLRKLDGWIERRRAIAGRYDEAFASLPGIKLLQRHADRGHAYHLYVVRVKKGGRAGDRDQLFTRLREKGLGVNVHYIPVHLHPYYRREQGTGPGLCPVAEAAYEELLTLPLYPSMTDGQVEQVIDIMRASLV